MKIATLYIIIIETIFSRYPFPPPPLAPFSTRVVHRVSVRNLAPSSVRKLNILQNFRRSTRPYRVQKGKKGRPHT